MTKHRFDELDRFELRTVDRICAEYEASGEPSVGLIERHVSEAPEQIQSVLFGELLALELELNGRGGWLPSPVPYLSRFPARREQIDSIFGRLSYEQSETQSPSKTIASEPDIVEVPNFIGRFRVEKVLGQGGFGIVYKAYDEQLDRPVAIKVPRARFVSRSTSIGNCLAEAKSVARLDHPHIVPVYELGSSEEFPFFLVTKYVDGNSLAERLNPKQIGDPLAVAQLIATIAEALQHAHEQGLVHRDVKPGNILIDSQGQPHLTDFGLVLREEDIGNDSGYAGTPAYMSPEQAGGRRAPRRRPQRYFQPGDCVLRIAGRTPTLWR